ncbi:MAG: class I SAM-dependent methyltransferase [Phycisphaerales bacterium]
MKHTCLICGTPIEPFMSFGPMPLGNGFRKPDDARPEYRFEMEPAVCPSCTTFQLVRQPSPEQMFHGEYAFFSGTSKRMGEHFAQFAQVVRRDFLQGADPFVVELGSNDGIMMRNFAGWGVRHLGVEPSANVAAAAQKAGVRTKVAFFSPAVAQQIVQEDGQADAVLAANVMCHIPTINQIAEGIAALLKPQGVLAFEDPYLGDVLEQTTYDQIYDEHTFLFTVHSVNAIFGRVGMEVFRAEPQWTHGGSMRYYLARRGVRAQEASVKQVLERERTLGVDKPETYQRFRKACEDRRAALVHLLKKVRGSGARVVGYGATSKSTTILNYCGIGPDLIDFITDTTPTKQGKVTPGSHIPVKPHADFAAGKPEYALLFAYNHAQEIMEKEREFTASGGKWITYVPEVKVL